MDTGRIKQFAIESRKILKEGVMQRIRALGFDEQGHTPGVPEKVQGGTRYHGRMIENERFYDSWIALNEHIQRVGVKAVYEEAAYTWFNRLIAIRIMQKNHFIEPVLSYDNPEIRVPHIVSEARRGSIMCALTDDEQNRLRNLLMDDTKTQEQFALLIIAYCRENAVISKCFGGIAPYLELLLPDDILSQNRFIDLLNNTNEYITEEQFRSAELIGWLYQFYISEKKDEVFASFKNGRKAEAEDIPAATQIFTPNWIVKYMVQNTVGRIYLDNNPYCPLKKDWKYLVEPTEKTPKEAILKIDDLAELTLADLACGSGHILVEGFDILYSLYIDEGYSRYDAVKNIFTKNLTGIDLDTRAKQLATFALLLKAAQIDPKFLDGEVMPRVYDMPKVNLYTWRDLGGHMTCALQMQGGTEEINEEIEECFTLMEQAQNLGSIMKFNISDATRDFIKKCVEEQNRQHKFEDQFADLFHGFNIILALTEKYAALAANPPYMGSGNMNDSLRVYLSANYPDAKSDLFATFMEQMLSLITPKGRMGCITMEAWMFLSTYENFRKKILETYYIPSLTHFGWHIIGIAFGTVMAIFEKNCPKSRIGEYSYMTIDDIDREKRMPIVYPIKDNGRYSQKDQNTFLNIPGYPIGYWVNDKVLNLFATDTISNHAFSDGKNVTGDNDKYLRFLWEVDVNRIGKGMKWMLQTKGGPSRKWYGNMMNVIAWSPDDIDFYHKNKISRVIKEYLWYKEGVTWSKICSSGATFRLLRSDSTYDEVNITPNNNEELYDILAVANSKLSLYLLEMINPTFSVQTENVLRLPFKVDKSITRLSRINVKISQEDWDAHETSWDFEVNEVVSYVNESREQGLECTFVDKERNFGSYSSDANPSFELKDLYQEYITKWTEKFVELHTNEEELNRQFIEIYGLEDELTPDVPLDEITILQQGEISIENNQIVWHPDVIMKQLISYAIGCMMGRYRLDKKGLCIAHPNPSEEEYAPYEYHGSTFSIDDDGIIPLMSKDSRFDDNGVNRLTDFVKLVFGEETLTDNMNFLEEALGKSVEQYLVKDFWKDHKKIYQNRPIYWLFSSKKGAFQVIAYMHRMNKYTVENIRNKYLLPHIEYLRQELASLDTRVSALTTQERKQYQKLQKDLEECMEYHDRLHSVADQQIDFDLDDGVVVNYAKFGDVLAKLK